MSKNTGGPAFPGSYTGNHGMPVWSDGMALRDYFAAKAMQAYLSCNFEDCAHNPDKLAAWAYENADAMLAARDKA